MSEPANWQKWNKNFVEDTTNLMIIIVIIQLWGLFQLVYSFMLDQIRAPPDGTANEHNEYE